MFIRIGLTGGIASGKSTVAGHLRELGAKVIDYDALAARVVAPGGPALHSIAQVFGPGALHEDGTLDRAWMADRVFGSDADPDARGRLDAIEHPLIYDLARQEEEGYLRAIRRECAGSDRGYASNRRVVVHDVPLLAEVMDDIPFSFDHVVTVEAPEFTRIERMIRTRGMSREQAVDRIRHQVNREERLQLADIVIDSTQPIERMFETVDTLYKQWSCERIMHGRS